MPIRKKCLGVDLGSHSVKVAEVAIDKEGIKVLNLAQKEVNIAPGTPDSERQKILGRSVRDILKENKISTREAIFCISGQSVFVRQVKLPKTSPDRLKKIIRYEARQQIPFPLEKTIVEYQIFESEEKDEVNVLLVALKKEFIIDFMSLVSRTGLKPIGISVSSFAIYNYYAFDSIKKKPEEEKKKKGFKFDLKSLKVDLKGFINTLKKKGKEKGKGEVALGTPSGEMPFEEVKAYVNIGATTLDLAIARLGKSNVLGFTRSVPHAGNEITRNIQDKCSVETFQEAEELKKKNTIILSSGVEESPGENINLETSEAATQIVDRIVADIRRSLDFYMAQPDGMAVDCIFLSGGQVKIPNIETYIGERLGLHVEVMHSPSDSRFIFKEQSPEITPYIIALGLAIMGINKADVTIDFLPGELKTVIEFKKKNVLIFTIIVLIVIMIGISTQVGDKAKTRYFQDISYYDNAIRNLKPNKDEADNAIKLRNQLKETYQYLDWALGKRDFWIPVMVEIQQNKPSDMWIQELKMEPYGIVRITGYTERQESAATFTKNLKEVFKEAGGKTIVSEKDPELMNIFREKPSPALQEYWKFVVKLKLKGKISRIQDRQVDEDELKRRTQPGTYQPQTGYYEPGMPQPAMPGTQRQPSALPPMDKLF